MNRFHRFSLNMNSLEGILKIDMEKKKRKNKKSSYIGRVGSSYSVDARIFKTGEQRKSVEENLETPEGCKRLLKNSNPTYWFLVMGEVWEHQRDYRWIGYNRVLDRAPSLETPLKHRIVHTLRLDDKDYYYEKMFAVELMNCCDLYHPKFLKDYIDFYYNIDGYLKDVPFEDRDKEHKYLNHMNCGMMAYDSEEILLVITKILNNWDEKYSYPEKLKEFFDWIKTTLDEYENFQRKGIFKDRLFRIEHLLREIFYHDKRYDWLENDTVFQEEVLSSMDTELILSDLNIFFDSIKDMEGKEKYPLFGEEFKFLKENLFSELLKVYRISSCFRILNIIQKKRFEEIYRKYSEKLNELSDSLSSYNIHNINIDHEKFRSWNIRENLSDFYMYSLLSVIRSLSQGLGYDYSDVDKEENLRAARLKNPEIIHKLLNQSEFSYDFPYDYGEDIDDHLRYKYEEDAKEYGLIETDRSGYNSFFLMVDDRDKFADEFLKGFHEMEVKEQERRLELLYLSEAAIPGSGFYTNDYQFYLMTLNITCHWEKGKYFSFLREIFESGSTFQIKTAVSLSEKRAFEESDELVEMLYNHFNIEHPKEIRLDIVEAMNRKSDAKWWNEKRVELLRNWIANEDDEEVKKEVRSLFRWIMKNNSQD